METSRSTRQGTFMVRQKGDNSLATGNAHRCIPQSRVACKASITAPEARRKKHRPKSLNRQLVCTEITTQQQLRVREFRSIRMPSNFSQTAASICPSRICSAVTLNKLSKGGLSSKHENPLLILLFPGTTRIVHSLHI